MFVSLTIDLLFVLAIAAGAFWFAAGARWTAAILVAATAIAVWILVRGVWGTSVGHAVAGLRSIDLISGLPSFRLHARRETVFRSRANDPFALFPQKIAGVGVLRTPVRTRPRFARMRLIVDDGTVHTVAHSAIIGRDPSPDSPHAVVSVPDITRTISREHVLVEITSEGVAVTDLRAANRTWVLGERDPLIAEQPTPVPWGSTLLLGDRRIRIEQPQREAS